MSAEEAAGDDRSRDEDRTREETESNAQAATDPTDEIVARLTEIAGSVQRLLTLQVERTRVEFRERAFRVSGWLFLALVLASFSLAACAYLLRGVAGLVSQLAGDIAWAGDLAAAAVALLIVGAVGWSTRARLRRRNLRRVRKRFEAGAANPLGVA